MELKLLVVDYDTGCIVATLEGGKSVTIPLNGVEFAAVSLKLRHLEYDMSVLGKKLKEFHDLLHNLSENSIVGWLEEFMQSHSSSESKDYDQVVIKLFSDVRRKFIAKLGDNDLTAHLPKANRVMDYSEKKDDIQGEIFVLNGTPGIVLSKDGTEIEYIPEDIKGELTIPEGVTKLEGYIFEKCDMVTRIKIPKSIRSLGDFNILGDHVFSKLCRLKHIEVAQENPVYKSINGTLLNKEGTKLIFVPRERKGDFFIPEGVTEIGEYAFAGCTGLTSITISEGVIDIGESAFSGCTELKKVTIPEGVRRIGSSAFNDCIGLTSIAMPESVVEIGGFAFCGCIGLTHVIIPENVTKIERNVFQECEGLTSIVIPKSIITIGGAAFNGCKRLTNITIPESVTEIGYWAFRDCSRLTSVAIPEGVIQIGDNAFYGCIGLKSIRIPEGVSEIDDGAFLGCTELKSVTIQKGVTKIGNGAFFGCTGLTDITLPVSIIEIGNGAFEDCEKLTNIAISEWVTEIGEDAFKGCTKLQSIQVATKNPVYKSGMEYYSAKKTKQYY